MPAIFIIATKNKQTWKLASAAGWLIKPNEFEEEEEERDWKNLTYFGFLRRILFRLKDETRT